MMFVRAIKKNACRPLFGAGVLLLLGATLCSAERIEIPVLKVRDDTFTNVVVTLVTPTDIYFSHSRGLANAKLKNLDTQLQEKFHFDPNWAELKEREQAESNTRYMTALLTRPAPARSGSGKNSNGNGRPENSKVRIEAASPEVEYVYYDRSGPRPAQVPEGMHGVTAHTFTCQTACTFQWNQKRKSGPFSFRVVTTTISLGLPITITLPEGASDKLKAHEEGHRKIHEHFYTFAAASAQKAGELLIGKELISEASDFEAAKDEIMTDVARTVETEYWKYTREPSELAGRFYDELTGHGRNPIDSEEAAQQAVERYEVTFPEASAGVH